MLVEVQPAMEPKTRTGESVDDAVEEIDEDVSVGAVQTKAIEGMDFRAEIIDDQIHLKGRSENLFVTMKIMLSADEADAVGRELVEAAGEVRGRKLTEAAGDER